jgi:hypothetical protein
MNRLLRNSTSLSGALLAALALSGCVLEDSSLLGDGSCSKPFSKTVRAAQIQGNDHLVFDIADFLFVADPTIRADGIQLSASLRGRKNGSPTETTLSLNGLATAPLNGERVYELLQYVVRDDRSDVRFHLHRLTVNGAESFRSFAARVLRSRGQLRIDLHGKNVRILGAEILVSGRALAACPSPTPTASGSPAPVIPPHTSISGAVPTNALLTQTSIAISFASDQVDSSFRCSLDGGAVSACTSPQSYGDLSNGRHTFHVTAVTPTDVPDPAGA